MPSIQERIAVVQSYIFHRKEVEVQINVAKIYADILEEMKLNTAYNYAVQWFKNNGGNINLL